MNQQPDLAQITFREDDFQLCHVDEQLDIDRNFSSQSYWKEAWVRFRKNRLAVVALIAVVAIIILALAGPVFSGYSVTEQDVTRQNMAPRIPGLEKIGIFDGTETLNKSTGSVTYNKYQENGLEDVYYWFGSDSLGRDIWTRVWSGTQVSLLVAFVAVAIDLAIGLSYGLTSGYFGGKTDMIMQRIVEIINSIPTLVTVTLLMLVMKPGLVTIILALGFTGWVGMSRIARAEMLKLKESEYVLASKTLGAKAYFIIFREIFPNMIGPVITNTMFSIPNAIFMEAYLSFIGLGIPVPLASLGSLISDAYKQFTTHPYQIVWPVVVLSVLMLCFNILADGLREALDPKMKEM